MSLISTAAKSYGKLQKRLSLFASNSIYLTKRETNLEKASYGLGVLFELLGLFSIQRKVSSPFGWMSVHCLIWSLFKNLLLTYGVGWKSSSGVILGVRNGWMIGSIPLSSFSALVTGETSYFYPLTYLGKATGFCTGNTGWESPCLLAGAM